MCPTYLVGNGALTRPETLAHFRAVAHALSATIPGGIVELSHIPRSVHLEAAFVVFVEDATAEIGAAAVLLSEKHPIALYGRTPDDIGLYLRDAVDSKSVVIEMDPVRAAAYITRALEESGRLLTKRLGQPVRPSAGWGR